MRVQVVDESALPATGANKKIQPYVEALKQIEPGKSLKVVPETDETTRGLKRRFKTAAPLAGLSIELLDADDGFFVVAAKPGRIRARRSTTPSPTGRRRGRPPKSAAS